MSYNPYAFSALKRKLVQRSTNPYYKGQFALVSDVNMFNRFDAVTKTMIRAAQSMADPYYIHFKTEADEPADMVRLVPTILQSFNRTRTLRRACVSGIRLCNLLQHGQEFHYVSDMVVSCQFDAVSICAGLADYASLGSHLMVKFKVPPQYGHAGMNGARKFSELAVERFWNSSHLRRHSLFVCVESLDTSWCTLRFEPSDVSHIALLNYILGAFMSYKGVEVIVGRANRLVVSRAPMWLREDYLTYQPLNANANFRFRRAAAFGTYFHNPDYKLY